MAVLGVLNQSKKIFGPGQVYLVARPAGGYTGGTDALRIADVKSLFYSDSATDACRTLIPSPYSDITATGIDVKLKQNPIEFDPNMGGKYKAGNGPSEVTVTWTYKDMDANKIMDAFSAVTGDTLTTVAATGVAGRKSVLIGRQGAPLEVAICVRFPVNTVSAGGVQEFQNIFVPYATITPEWELKVDKKELVTCKLTATGICDMSLIGTAAMPPICLTDDVTNPGL
jgi:hypothetical protein